MSLEPRILSPVSPGHRSVWVSGVAPGTNVSVVDGHRTIGEIGAARGVERIPVEPVAGPIRLIGEGPDGTWKGEEVMPLRDPAVSGPFATTSRDVDFGTRDIPRHETPEGVDGGFRAPLRGRIHTPDDGDGAIPDRLVRAPLVIVAHGYHYDERTDEESHLGYEWLCGHLASWGIVACSMTLARINRASRTGALQQWSRADLILAMIDAILREAPLNDRLDRGRIGLVGHSMGGEGVVLAQALNLRRRAPLGIRGVVSIAPTNHRSDVGATSTSYLQLHGSEDYLLVDRGSVTGEDPRYGGFRLVDRAWRPRGLAWIEGADHDGYNTVWSRGIARGALNLEEQHAIGRALITSFFGETLLDLPYRGYLFGPALPPSIEGATIRRQFQVPDVALVDDFGDPNGQFLLDPEDPADKRRNRRGGDAGATGFGLDRWEEPDAVDLAHNVHRGRCLDLAWTSPDAVYDTGLDGLRVDPRGWLSLRVAQHYREIGDDADETWNEAGRDLDLEVELDDGTELARLPLAAVEPIYFPLPGLQVYSIYQTIRLPVDAFLAQNPALDIGALRRLRLRPLRPAETGRVLIDEIAFETLPVTARSHVAMLRVHRLGGGYGPPKDFLDTEVIVQLADRPDERFGFQLRAGHELSSAHSRLALLRDAIVNRRRVALAYRWTGPTVRTVADVVAK